MESLIGVLTCQLCNQTFSGTPIVLSCCDATICRSHIKNVTDTIEVTNSTNPNTYECELCLFSHDMNNKRFATNKVVEKLLKMKLDKLKFGEIFEKAGEECDQLEFTLFDFENLKKDPENYIFEYVAGLKRVVDLRKEKIKLEIESLSDVMIKKLETFEKECYENLKILSVQEKICETNLLSEQSRAKLDEWTNNLNILVIDESKWKEIQSGAKELDIKLLKCISDLKNDLLMHKVWAYNSNHELTKNFSHELLLFDG